MADNKKNTAAAAALVAAFAAGAGAQRVVAPPLETSARPGAFMIARDGYGLQVVVKAGAAEATRILNWDRNGAAPHLDGQPFDNDRARAIGAAAAAFAKVVEPEVAELAGDLARPLDPPKK